MAEASMMAMDPSMVRPSLRPSTFPRRMQQERACSSALAPGSDAMYCSCSIVYYCPRAPSAPRLLLVICSRGVAMAARGLRGRQAHRTAPHCTAQQYSIPSPWPMHPRRPKFPCRSFPLQLCFPVPSSRSLLFPSLAFGAQLLRAAPTPCNVPCLSTTVCCWYGRMVVVSTVDRSTTTILRTAVEW